MRALRPAALPSDTSVRFCLLLAAVTTASLYMFQALWFAARGQGFLTVVRDCGLAGTTSTTLGGVVAELGASEECRSAISREQALIAVGGAFLVLVAAWALYRVMPAWRERRRHLSEPDPLDGEALTTSVQQLAEKAGVTAPIVRLDVTDPAISGIAYGSGSQLRLGLSGGLVVAQITELPTYQAVVRHELGHVANRDVRWTYYSVATWWSFVALALAPVLVVFGLRDPQYVLRLGWRTAVLAGLVATMLAAVLRTRELYADARAADWGSAESLDRVLDQRTSGPKRSWRPALLRLHPDPVARRGLLADSDGLFTASGWVALAAALACGTALASIADISYLVASQWSVALSTLAVAPLLAVALCVPAWRVALRGAVRGEEPSVVWTLGLGAGVGVALAPQLTMAAAVGAPFSSDQGWLGYLIWAGGMVASALALAWWTWGTARLAVTAALGSPRGPGRALVVHVVVSSLLIALWLATSTQARLLLTNVDLAVLRDYAPWDLLPGAAFGVRLVYLPLALVPMLLLLPVWAHRALGHGVPIAAWLWRDQQPTQPGDLPRMPDAGSTRPPLVPALLVGAGAGAAAGSVVVGVLVAGEALPEALRVSDTFALALGTSIQWAVLVAGVVAGAVAVVVLPRLWWPLGLAASLAGFSCAAVVVWVLMTVNRYGFLQHSDVPARPLGLGASLQLLVQPAARATVPCVLMVALVGALRSWQPGRRKTDATAAVSPRRWTTRSLVGMLVAALVCGVLVIPRIAGVLTLQPQQVQTASVTIELPAVWTANVDPVSGSVLIDSVDGEIRVVLTPIAQPTPPAGTGSVLVGGVALPLVAQTDQGAEHWWVFEGQTPAGGQRLVVAGQPDVVDRRTDEIGLLLASVQWHETGPG